MRAWLVEGTPRVDGDVLLINLDAITFVEDTGRMDRLLRYVVHLLGGESVRLGHEEWQRLQARLLGPPPPPQSPVPGDGHSRG